MQALDASLWKQPINRKAELVLHIDKTTSDNYSIFHSIFYVA